MEVKKSPKADLENKRSTWLLVGYVAVLAVRVETDEHVPGYADKDGVDVDGAKQ